MEKNREHRNGIVMPPATKKHTTNGNCFSDRYRYFILLLGWLCLSSISSNMIALNFALICMSPPAIAGDEFLNVTTTTTTALNESLNLDALNEIQKVEEKTSLENKYDIPVFEYSNYDKASLMWSVAVGTMIGTFPFSVLYTHYGAKYVVFAAGILSALSTVLIPAAAVMGLPYFLALRFIQGIAYSADFAAMGVLCSRWASLKQNALFISVLTCYSPLSSTITNPVAGMMCESRYGWPLVYYSHAAVSIALFLLWIYFYDDHPRHCNFVSEVELEKIHRNKTEAHINMNKFIPYKAILKTKLVWVIWLNAFADLFSAMFLIMYQPMYMKYVLNYSIEKTGFLGALPTLVHMPLKFAFGYASDKLNCIPERRKMIIFNTTAVAFPGLLYSLVGFISIENPFHTVLLFTILHMFFASGGGGFYKCATLCGRQYSHFIVANIQFVKCITLFLGPALMSYFVTDETAQEQWRTVFIIMAVSLLLANLLFAFEATDQPAKFTEITEESYREKAYKKQQN